MAGNGKISRDTRRRLIESACRLFAEKGYNNTSISDICINADANVAAVNYHFGDKKGLFEQVWRYGNDVATEKYPVPKNEDASNRQRVYIRSFVSAMVGRAFDRDIAGCFSRIMAREMAEPVGRTDVAEEDLILSETREIREVICCLLGSDGTKREIDLCMFSILGPFLLLMLHSPLESEFFADENPDSRDLEAMVDGFTRFILAGLHSIKMSIENGKDENFGVGP